MKKAVFALLTFAIFSAPVMASTFWRGHVVGVAKKDVLYVRTWPASYSAVVGKYKNGESVSLTGRCKNISSNQSFRIDGGRPAAWKYQRMEANYVWCQVMTGKAKIGWVRGKYVWPQ